MQRYNMRSIFISLSLLLALSPLSALTPGYSSHYLNGGSAIDTSVAFNIDRAISPRWSLNYGITLGRQSHINQIQYLGDLYLAGLRLEPRYYFKGHDKQGIFVGGLLQLQAINMPFISSNEQNSTFISGLAYGLKAGFKYAPMKLNLNSKLAVVGIEPYISLKSMHYFDFLGLADQALWFTVGIHLIIDISIPYKPHIVRPLSMSEQLRQETLTNNAALSNEQLIKSPSTNSMISNKIK